MYTVQIWSLMLDCDRPCGQEWTDLATISQRETDGHERAEAEALMSTAREHYRRVRVVKSLPSGLLQHVAGD